ncbi:MAG: riboflavin synthase [Thermoanaerobaculum sp.]|nr:riboflavin synthase [Thermoanaerobaculum sp.]MDW7967151.1 riboflavin synthase [Thermoanaerobaculum sp.]
MFSGIVQGLGTLLRRQGEGAGQRLWVRGRVWEPPVQPGESVAVNGVCLTLEEVRGEELGFYCSQETVKRTTLGMLPVGSLVNLERALRAGDFVGGHWVSGHVDARVRVLAFRPQGEGAVLRCEIPRTLSAEVATKGSVAVDGVSLTVAQRGSLWFEVSLVPFTLRQTTLGTLRPGAVVNLETDLLAKYVRQVLGRTR